MAHTIHHLLVCPITKQNLFPLDKDKTNLLLDALSAQALLYIDGTKVAIESDKLQFLITENRHHVYSVVDGVPILLESKQIDLNQLAVH